MSDIDFQQYPNRSAASVAAAQLLAYCVERQWQTERRASIVVSGGSTPGECFDALSRKTLPWSDVTVVPSDERWVPATHKDSNERLIRERLLQNQASSGHVLSLFRQDLATADAITTIEADLNLTALPFACVMLGMGEDGHFASLFSDFDGLDQALNPENSALSVPVKTASSPYQRMSLTLSALRQTQQTALLIFGQPKRLVFEAALNGDNTYPVQKLLANLSSPLTVFWAA